MKQPFRATTLLTSLFVIASCLRAPSAPDLEKVLVLVTELERQEVRAGQSLLATFVVRNISDRTVDTCIDGDGVSVVLRSPDGAYRFPIILYGGHLHAACPNETRFEPGEEKVYRQRLFTTVHLTAEHAVFEASLALKQHPKFRTGPGATYFSIKSVSTVHVKPFTAD